MDDLNELEIINPPLSPGDLILYIDDCSLILSRIVNFEENSDTVEGYNLCISDIKIIRKAHEEHVLEIGYAIFVRDVFKNFGNITLEEFEENYPEWTI